jgi:hypothetical protein|mmetsp:Transcript_15966/g.27156  ORF Transcript_15966/g.27156 Transcript_15966/m.27156 type:complete len:88 (+) Transcript_15966:564-827(+)
MNMSATATATNQVGYLAPLGLSQASLLLIAAAPRRHTFTKRSSSETMIIIINPSQTSLFLIIIALRAISPSDLNRSLIIIIKLLPSS